MRRPYLILVCFIMINCSNDDGQKVLKNIEGTILSTVSCNTQDNGLAYEIHIESPGSIDKIIVSNLPNEFKKDGTKVSFDMENSTEGLSACVTLYSPEMFYKLKNIQIIDN